MTSSLYRELTPEELSTVITAALNTGIVSARLLTGGLFNTTYFVDTEGCGRVVLRVGPVNRHLLMPFEHHLMEAESQAYALCERQGCPSRSEALRDIIRDALVQDSLHSETADAAGVLSLIYDHHVRDLSRKLTERQHDAHGLIVTTLHVHLDHHNCLEILVLKGKAGELRELADQLRSIRGVTHGTFSITTIGADLP